MSIPNAHKATKAECCTEGHCESGLRNNYFEGKRLTPDAFRVEQRYMVERRWLLNRAIHGWGVVYGYGIVADDQPMSRRLKITPGLALDPCGRELLQVGRLGLRLDDVIVIDGKRPRVDRERAFVEAQTSGYKAGKDSEPGCWLLSVHYAEQGAGRVPVSDPCRCDHDEWDHTCETVRFSLSRIRCDECCADVECGLKCGCGSGRCCDDEVGPKSGKKHPDERKHERTHTRGGCRCLCDHLTKLPLPACDGPLCEIKETCGTVRVDLGHGVPLACVDVVRDECGDWTFGTDIEACGPRPLVKRNDLLFDLIRGCDLTRISEIGWSKWHRQTDAVPFDAFSEALGRHDNGQLEYVTKDFWVRFSGPVREDSLRPDCFAITVMSADPQDGWWEVRRVPILRLETQGFRVTSDSPNHVRGARIVVDGSWMEDGVRGRRSLFLAGDSWVEIEVRGDFIVDCNGQTVDANAVGLSPARTGNGTPGGTLLSSFRVAAARETPFHPAKHETADRLKGASS